MRAPRNELVLCMLHVSLCCLNRVSAHSQISHMQPPNVRSLCLMLLICYVLPLHPALLATPVLAASPVRLRLIPHAPFCRLLSLSVLSPCCHRVSRSCPASALLPVCSSCLPLSSSCSVRPAPPCFSFRRFPPAITQLLHLCFLPLPYSSRWHRKRLRRGNGNIAQQTAHGSRRVQKRWPVPNNGLSGRSSSSSGKSCTITISA